MTSLAALDDPRLACLALLRDLRRSYVRRERRRARRRPRACCSPPPPARRRRRRPLQVRPPARLANRPLWPLPASSRLPPHARPYSPLSLSAPGGNLCACLLLAGSSSPSAGRLPRSTRQPRRPARAISTPRPRPSLPSSPRASAAERPARLHRTAADGLLRILPSVFDQTKPVVVEHELPPTGACGCCPPSLLPTPVALPITPPSLAEETAVEEVGRSADGCSPSTCAAAIRSRAPT